MALRPCRGAVLPAADRPSDGIGPRRGPARAAAPRPRRPYQPDGRGQPRVLPGKQVQPDLPGAAGDPSEDGGTGRRLTGGAGAALRPSDRRFRVRIGGAWRDAGEQRCRRPRRRRGRVLGRSQCVERRSNPTGKGREPDRLSACGVPRKAAGAASFPHDRAQGAATVRTGRNG